MSPRARQEADEAKVRGRGTVDVIVRFRQAPSPKDKHLVLEHGGTIRRHFRPSSRWLAARLPASRLAALAKNPAVEFIASDAHMAAAMDVARQAADAPPPSAPETSFTGAGVTIAVVDSGVAVHPDIQNLVAAVDVVSSYPTVLPVDPLSTVDPYGHGTHVAGILVGNGSQSIGGRLAGIAPGANLVSVRVLDGLGQGQTSDLLAGLQWVLANKDQLGIRVVNLSLGHPVFEPGAQDPLVQEVDALWDAGVVVVCSAGNDGRSGYGTITSPCNSRKVITVGALNDWRTPDTSDDTVTSYSSRGPTSIDHVVKPDILAPGNKIHSTRAAGSELDVAYPGWRVADDPNFPDVQNYFELSGTSMAAPMVSGTAALMLEQDPTLNPATVKARLMLSARKAAFGDPFSTGAGVLDILSVLRTTGQVTVAPSPLVSADSVTGLLDFEDTGVLWSNPEFSLTALWSSSVQWSGPAQGNPSLLSSPGAMLPDLTLSPYATLWPDATLWPQATLWPDSTLWSEAVLWPDAPPTGLLLQGEALMVPDP